MQYQVEAQRIYYADPSGTVLAEITFPEVEPGVYCIDIDYVCIVTVVEPSG